MAAQHSHVHVFEKADAPQRPVAGLPLPHAARAAADVEILQHDGKAALQHLRIGQARVGHMRVHRRRAVEAGARRRAGADRLVILMGRVAEGEVVHRALRGAERAERAEQRVGHRLRHLDIARDHGRGIARR